MIAATVERFPVAPDLAKAGKEHHERQSTSTIHRRGEKTWPTPMRFFQSNAVAARAGGRQLEPRAPGLLIFPRALPVAGAHGGDARGEFLRRFHRGFLEGHVGINDPQVVEQKKQQRRSQRDEKRRGVRREKRPHHQPERIKQIQRRAGGQNALRVIQHRIEIGGVGGIQLRQRLFCPNPDAGDHRHRPAPSTSSRRSRLEMPRSSSIVRANDEPRKCRFNVERISHQPSA